ncbi:hypothetical protein D3C87_2134280 [compost metagenome]
MSPAGDLKCRADAVVTDLFGVLLDEDRIGAFRHRSAGEYANGFAGAERAFKGTPRGGSADDCEF